MRAREPDFDGYVERDGVKFHYEVFGAGDPTILHTEYARGVLDGVGVEPALPLSLTSEIGRDPDEHWAKSTPTAPSLQTAPLPPHTCSPRSCDQ